MLAGDRRAGRRSSCASHVASGADCRLLQLADGVGGRRLALFEVGGGCAQVCGNSGALLY